MYIAALLLCSFVTNMFITYIYTYIHIYIYIRTHPINYYRLFFVSCVLIMCIIITIYLISLIEMLSSDYRIFIIYWLLLHCIYFYIFKIYLIYLNKQRLNKLLQLHSYILTHSLLHTLTYTHTLSHIYIQFIMHI